MAGMGWAMEDGERGRAAPRLAHALSDARVMVLNPQRRSWLRRLC